MTREERHLWYDFLGYSPRFVRQKVVDVIFWIYCDAAGLAIELDGS